MTIDHDQLRQRIQAIIDADKDLSVRSVSIASGSDSWLHKFMTSDASMKLVQLNKLAEALGVSSEWLLFGNQERAEISDAQIDQLTAIALDEIQPGAPLSEIRTAVAGALRAQLARVLSGQLAPSRLDEATAPGTAAQSPAPTKRSAPAGSRTT
ncbi:hypothetical protein FJY63_00825 [Candidatus Sumerlaeota bacterium]|nr:hypothetical protein [Candidatus Sumerlaeota bacterium]